MTGNPAIHILVDVLNLYPLIWALRSEFDGARFEKHWQVRALQSDAWQTQPLRGKLE